LEIFSGAWLNLLWEYLNGKLFAVHVKAALIRALSSLYFTCALKVHVIPVLMQDSVWPVPYHIYVFAQQRLLIIGAAE
jgi:hypothetical protein